MRKIIGTLALAVATGYTQTVPSEYSIAHGNGAFEFTDVSLFRASEERVFPYIEAKVQNKTGLEWNFVKFEAVIATKNGGTHRFRLDQTGEVALDLGAERLLSAPVRYPFPFSPETVKSLAIVIADGEKIVYEKTPSYMGVVVTAEDCLPDFAAALKAGGLEMRKKLSELVAYGCAVQIEDPEGVKTLSVKSIPAGTKKPNLSFVQLDWRRGWIPTAAIEEREIRRKERLPPSKR